MFLMNIAAKIRFVHVSVFISYSPTTYILQANILYKVYILFYRIIRQKLQFTLD